MLNWLSAMLPRFLNKSFIHYFWRKNLEKHH